MRRASHVEHRDRVLESSQGAEQVSLSFGGLWNWFGFGGLSLCEFGGVGEVCGVAVVVSSGVGFWEGGFVGV